MPEFWGGDEYTYAQLFRSWQEGRGFAAVELCNRFAEAGNRQARDFWRVLASQAGLYHEAYDNAMRWVAVDPARAFAQLRFAFSGLHPEAPFALDKLFRSCSHEVLGLSSDEFCDQAVFFAELCKSLRDGELDTALLTGTRPIIFQERFETPCMENLQWGAGSLFVVQWGEQQFAVTAKHVVENLGAEPSHFRLILPEYGVALEVDSVMLSSDAIGCEDEFEDVYVWRIDQNTKTDKAIEWWAFDLKRWYSPALYLKPGQQLFAVGYPDAPERYDAEKFIINEIPIILQGVLSAEQLFEGMLTMDVEESKHDLDGMSGGPVFTKYENRFHYVGLIVRGSREARKLHFIDARHVVGLLGQAVRKIY